jgi:NAD-dependent SIR2 family protein deacetylase
MWRLTQGKIQNYTKPDIKNAYCLTCDSKIGTVTVPINIMNSPTELNKVAKFEFPYCPICDGKPEVVAVDLKTYTSNPD